VSKKFLAGIRFVPVENKTRRKWTAQAAQARKSALPSGIAAHLEFPLVSDANFDLIAFFQVESFDYL
jgi:hypothetical protein